MFKKKPLRATKPNQNPGSGGCFWFGGLSTVDPRKRYGKGGESGTATFIPYLRGKTDPAIYDTQQVVGGGGGKKVGLGPGLYHRKWEGKKSGSYRAKPEAKRAPYNLLSAGKTNGIERDLLVRLEVERLCIKRGNHTAKPSSRSKI